MKKKYKIGDKVVALSPDASWRNETPTYLPNMENYIGLIGRVVWCTPIRTSHYLANIYLVRFAKTALYYYRDAWIRKATKIDEKISNLIRQVRGKV